MTSNNVIRQRICKYIAGIILFLGGNTYGYGQAVNDFEVRQELGVDWQPLKKLQVKAYYRLNTFENAARFKRSMFELSTDYAVYKWLSLGGEYRYYLSYIKDYNRFALYLKLNYSLGRFSVKDRFQYQQDQDYLNEEYLAFNPPQRAFRNKLSISFAKNRKLSYYVYAEPFVELKHQELNWYRMRYGLGAEYLYKRRHEVGAELFFNNNFQIKAPQNTLTLKFSYTYHLTKKKKKKKNTADDLPDTSGSDE